MEVVATLNPVQPENARIEIEDQPDGSRRLIRLFGVWKNTSLSALIKSAGPLVDDKDARSDTIDLSAVSGIDTAGAWLIRRYVTDRREQGRSVEIVGAHPEMRDLIEALPEKVTPPEKPVDHRSRFERVFEPVGRLTVSLWGDLVAMMFVLGSAVRGAQTKLGRGAGVSPASVVNQLDHMGVRAVPIITLMSFLIGAIIAQQGAFQLRYFGAEVFVVDLVSILQLREIGVLLTAIMIAGRSGSAITAEIGSMKMREEIDALKVIGLNPIGVLVFPRLVALTIALPLLTIVANFAALYGAAVVAWGYSGITFDVFITRLHDAVDYSTLATGMIKAPFTGYSAPKLL